MSRVRFARPEDIPALIELARQIHVQSRYAWMPFNAARLWSALEAALGSKQHCVIVAAESAPSNDGGTQADQGFAALIGLLWARASALPFTSEFVAQIDCFYVTPRRRGSPVAMKMMAGLRRWADNREVAEILVANTFGANEACSTYSTRLLGKLGLKAAGGVHSMWLERR